MMRSMENVIRYVSDGNGLAVFLMDGGNWHMHTRPESITILTPEAEHYVGGGSMSMAIGRLRGYLSGKWDPERGWLE